MKTKYKTSDGSIEISIRQRGRRKIAWALSINGQYKKTKILPINNTAIVQNFGYVAEEFN